MKKLIYAAIFAIVAGKAIACDKEYMLALNMYREARGESLQGQLAVAEVTLNRVSSQLQSLGINVLDASGELRNLDTVIMEVGT